MGWGIQHWVRRDGTSSCDWYDQGKDPEVKSPCLKPLDADIKSVLGQMIDISERIASKMGASWLRVDFFVGGEQGLRVNELAYGSGLPYPKLNDDVRDIMYRSMTSSKYKVVPALSVLKNLGCELESSEDPSSIQCGKKT